MYAARSLLRRGAAAASVTAAACADPKEKSVDCQPKLLGLFDQQTRVGPPLGPVQPQVGRPTVVDAAGGSTLMGAAFSAAWFSAIVPATAGMVATGAVLGSVFMAPFWLAGGAVLKTTLVDPAKKTTLSIGRYAWELSQTLPGGVAVSSDRGATDELAGADVAVTVVTNGVPQYACRLVAGARAWGLGDGLPRGELEWVASEINDQLSSFAEARTSSRPRRGA